LPICERSNKSAGDGLGDGSRQSHSCLNSRTNSTLRAPVLASASTAALAPRRRFKAQSFAISRNMPFQWRKKGGRWP
jgi:hypothetical protein